MRREGERASERGERGGGRNTVGFGHNWKTTKRAQHAPSGRHIDGCRSQHFTYSPLPPSSYPLRSDPGENGAPRRRRARLCGGGHRKEAHPQGNRERQRGGGMFAKIALRTLRHRRLTRASIINFPSSSPSPTITGQDRVPGQVARMVSQVSLHATFPISAMSRRVILQGKFC